MHKRLFFIFLFFLVGILASAFASINLSNNQSKYILKQIRKEITTVFLLKDFKLMEKSLAIPPSLFLRASTFYKIESQTKKIGYAIVVTAPSKTDVFEYLILTDEDLKIKKAKVLIYREDYGGEIASKRWLSQFVNHSSDHTYVYGDNISAISGATISVHSITSSINHLFDFLRVLKLKGNI